MLGMMHTITLKIEHMYWLKLRVVFILIILILMSCEKKWQTALKRIEKSQFYFNNFEGWELIQEHKGKWDTHYTIKKNDNDTLKVLFFLQRWDGSIAVNEYRKQYPCGDIDTCYLEMASGDTLFFYKQRNGLKTFLLGEYYYRFTKMQLDSNELAYYMLYEDSLRLVRGNDLPPLPTLNERERRRLDSLLNR